MKKNRLLAMIDSGNLQIGKANNGAVGAGTSRNAQMDREFAAFQVRVNVI
jgi:hypothetical protein